MIRNQLEQGIQQTSGVCFRVCSIFAVFCLVASAFGAQTVVTYKPDIGEQPVSVAVDWLGNKYVSMQPICEVRRYDLQWRQTHTFKLPCSGSDKGSGLAVEPWGTFYVGIANADSDANRGVYVVQPWGEIRRLPGTEKMLFPNSLAFDHIFGTLYVTDMTAGQVWRIRPHHPAELWLDAPELKGPPQFGNLGANGLAIRDQHVYVSVSYPASLLRIPIRRDGSAGAVETLADTGPLAGHNVFAVDDIVLDFQGNIYVSVVFPYAVVRVSPDGANISSIADGLGSSVVSLAFERCWSDRTKLLVAINPDVGAGGTAAAILKIDAGVPGQL